MSAFNETAVIIRLVGNWSSSVANGDPHGKQSSFSPKKSTDRQNGTNRRITDRLCRRRSSEKLACAIEHRKLGIPVGASEGVGILFKEGLDCIYRYAKVVAREYVGRGGK